MGQILSSRARVECLYDQASWTEGPAWWKGRLVFSDVVGRRVLAWSPDGSVRTLVDPSQFANGHAVAPDGRLLQCEHGRRGIAEVLGDGTTRVLAGQWDGKPLNSPNDIAVSSGGDTWFTDPTFGLTQPKQGWPAEPSLDHTSVYRLDAAGVLHRMVDLDQPNGIAFSPDERVLYVSETNEEASPRIVRFDVSWPSGELSGQQTFAEVDEGIPDGFCVDSRGWLWSSSGNGVHVFDPAGEHLGHIPVPKTVSNCTFDDTESTLFLTGDAYLWRLVLDPGNS